MLQKLTPENYFISNKKTSEIDRIIKSAYVLQISSNLTFFSTDGIRLTTVRQVTMNGARIWAVSLFRTAATTGFPCGRPGEFVQNSCYNLIFMSQAR